MKARIVPLLFVSTIIAVFAVCIHDRLPDRPVFDGMQDGAVPLEKLGMAHERREKSTSGSMARCRWDDGFIGMFIPAVLTVSMDQTPGEDPPEHGRTGSADVNGMLLLSGDGDMVVPSVNAESMQRDVARRVLALFFTISSFLAIVGFRSGLWFTHRSGNGCLRGCERR